ncbi:MAG: winged helix-turn-helix domain-containing protein [candidate division Zixibacteria bacterium]|nr:winged helix-turn-helix domain-containing protein [candidate division Zixibacteria bacterium]
MCAKESNRESLFGVGSGIGEALFSKIRRKVLTLFLLNQDKRFYFRETVRLLGDAPGSLQRELKSLTKAGILKMEPIGIQKFYQANTECPVFAELKQIAEKTFGIVDVFRDVLRSQVSDQIDIAWIYGSVANSSDTSSSDIDLMVLGSLSFRELVSILKPVEENMQRSVNPTLYSSDEFRKKLHDKNNFILNVMESEKLFIIGNEDDLARLAK